MQQVNDTRRMLPFLVSAAMLAFPACGRDNASDDTAMPVMMTPRQPQVTGWKDFTSLAVPISFKIPSEETQVVHDENGHLLVMYIDDGCQMSWGMARMSSNPQAAIDYVASKVKEETTGKAIVAPPVNYPLKSGQGSYWADKTGNIKRKHRLLIAHSGWICEVSVECDGDTLPDSLKPAFDSIMLRTTEESPAKSL